MSGKIMKPLYHVNNIRLILNLKRLLKMAGYHFYSISKPT